MKKKRKVRKLRKTVESHLGVSIDTVECVSHDIRPIEYVDLQRVIDRWAAADDPPARVVGFSSLQYFSGEDWLKSLVTNELIQAPVQRARLACGYDESLDCVQVGLYLLRRKGTPVIATIRPGRYSRDLPVLEVAAGARETARDTVASLLDEARGASVYKGHCIALEEGERREGVTIRFQRLRPTSREDIILPAELLDAIERNVLGLLKHGETMRVAGRSLRHGLLFHGPPGTGKTLTVRYLAQACPEHTVILLTGADQALVRHACQIARMLAPTIVILEDVDLIAEDRERNRCPSLLHDLMNEMDGLGPRAEVTFLLTTNRPDILEPALSARPGRIDQAIEFPLPDEECRRRLFEAFGRGLDLSGVDIARWVGQTDGVSPAFIEELLRKSVRLAAERGETTRPLRLTDGDIQESIRELVVFGGDLTQKLLGYRTGSFGLGGGRPG